MKSVKEAAVQIVGYTPEYKSAFKELNEEWITTYFWMEEVDYRALNNPEKILENGGNILVALLDGKAAGVCALIVTDVAKYDFELSKLAVAPEARGLGLGRLLCEAVIAEAKKAGAKKIFLESNTKLIPAISLYRKLGFKEVGGFDTHYERVNIQMELDLDADS